MHTFLDLCHRWLFTLLSWCGPSTQGWILRRWFEWWHCRPDPWGLAVDDYERHRYLTMLGCVPDRGYRRVLDVGCSEGVFTELLAARFTDAVVTGVDIAERALRRARARALARRSAVAVTAGDGAAVGGPHYLRADILTDHLPGPFDLVFCAEMLYYIGRPARRQQVSGCLRRLLAPGGILIVAHPWPEARLLHADLDDDRTLRRLHEQVDQTSSRPFAVTTYQASAAGEVRRGAD